MQEATHDLPSDDILFDAVQSVVEMHFVLATFIILLVSHSKLHFVPSDQTYLFKNRIKKK